MSASGLWGERTKWGGWTRVSGARFSVKVGELTRFQGWKGCRLRISELGSSVWQINVDIVCAGECMRLGRECW